MKILVAPNALKGSCSASAAARAMAEGLQRAAPTATVVQIPVADGGDGLEDVVTRALGARRVEVAVTGPRFEALSARFAWLSERRTAFIWRTWSSAIWVAMSVICPVPVRRAVSVAD